MRAPVTGTKMAGDRCSKRLSSSPTVPEGFGFKDITRAKQGKFPCLEFWRCYGSTEMVVRVSNVGVTTEGWPSLGYEKPSVGIRVSANEGSLVLSVRARAEWGWPPKCRRSERQEIWVWFLGLLLHLWPWQHHLIFRLVYWQHWVKYTDLIIYLWWFIWV